MRRAIVLLFAAGWVLTGCATPAESDEAGTSPSPSMSAPSPSVSSSEDPPAPSAVFPTDCNQLITDAQMSEIMGSGQVLATSPPSVTLPGPLARDTAARATETLGCLWLPEIAVDGSVPLFVLQLDEDAKETLIAGLRSSPEYIETTVDGELAFAAEFTDELFIQRVRYVFVDDVWIALYAPVFDDWAAEIVSLAVAGVRG